MKRPIQLRAHGRGDRRRAPAAATSGCRMDMVDLILTVCLAASPDKCRDEHLYFESHGSLMQCMFLAPTEIVKWSEQHPASRSSAGNVLFPARTRRSERRRPVGRVLGRRRHDGFATRDACAWRPWRQRRFLPQGCVPALAAAPVRIGVLKFGTVSWELDTLKQHQFDAANGVELDVRSTSPARTPPMSRCRPARSI